MRERSGNLHLQQAPPALDDRGGDDSDGPSRTFYCLVYNYFTGSWTPPSSCPATNATAPTGTTDNGDVMGYQYLDSSRPSSSHTATYTYDSLNRLWGATASTFWSQTYTYDRWGNMTCSGTGLCTSMGYNSNNQLTTVGGASLTYDAAGNLMQDNSAPHSYQWDAEGRMRQIDSGSSAIVTTFNALGQRAYRQNSSNFSASYSYDPSGHFLGGYGSGWWNAEVPFAGRVLAEYANGSPAPVYFDHPNALGWGSNGPPRRGAQTGKYSSILGGLSGGVRPTATSFLPPCSGTTRRRTATRRPTATTFPASPAGSRPTPWVAMSLIRNPLTDTHTWSTTRQA